MTIKLDLKESAPVQEEFRRQFKTAVDSALLELADHLQRNSPRGVSPASDSLAGGWDVIPARKARGVIPEVLGSVVNRAEAAEFRIRGRAPGKFPPYSEGSNLAKWAKAAGIPPIPDCPEDCPTGNRSLATAGQYIEAGSRVAQVWGGLSPAYRL
jgi:hypothetical protein